MTKSQIFFSLLLAFIAGVAAASFVSFGTYAILLNIFSIISPTVPLPAPLWPVITNQGGNVFLSSAVPLPYSLLAHSGSSGRIIRKRLC